MARPSILFGASTLGQGEFVGAKAIELLEWLQGKGITRFDTAALYPVSSPGKSEETLGQFQRSNENAAVDTKILLTDFSGKGSLAPDAIDRSVSASASRLTRGINALYCHLPDPETPVETSAAALDRQHAEKRFKQLGLSNFSPEQVASFARVCDEKHLIKPSVYQGEYNALNRGSEASLMPILRQHGMSFMAYSPVAGGFLTGNFTNGKDVKGTRFDDAHPGSRRYKAMYDKPELHAAVRKLEEGGNSHGIGLSEAALRWLYYHSHLVEGDGIILGASKVGQVQQNVEELRRGPLPDALVALFEDVWVDICAAKK